MANRREFNDDHFQQHYRQRYGFTGRPYEFYQAAYRYGWVMAQHEKYANRAWALSEGAMRRDWSRRFPHRSWDDLRDAVGEGWRSARED